MANLNQFVDSLNFDSNLLPPSENPSSIFNRLQSRRDWQLLAPDSTSLQCKAPMGNLASSPPSGYTAVYSGYVGIGIKFPVSPFLRYFILFLGVTLSQLSPSNIDQLYAFEYLCSQLGITSYERVFQLLFSISRCNAARTASSVNPYALQNR